MYPPDVGYAWWLMEEFWIELSALAEWSGRRCLLAYPAPGEVPQRIQDSGIEVVFQDFTDRSWSGVAERTRFLKRENVELVYLTGEPFFDPIYAAWRALGSVRTIVSHDHNPGDRDPVYGVKGAFKSARNQIGSTSCDLYISLSPLMLERALENARIPRERCTVVTNGIRPIDCGQEGTHDLRGEFGVDEADLLVVNVGRAHPYKNVESIIRAAERLLAMGRTDVKFVHIGDGPALEDLRAQARSATVLDTTFFSLGRRGDVRALLCGCDVAVHAAWGEGFSLAILEYMSAGLATLVPDIPSVKQAIDHDRTGRVYATDDTDVLVAELIRLADDRAEVARLGEAARAEVLASYTLEESRKQLRDEVAKLL